MSTTLCPAALKTPEELNADLEKLSAGIYLKAARKGLDPARVDVMMSAAICSTHERFQKLHDSVFPVIACVDSVVLQRQMLVEAAGLFLFRAEDVAADYMTWQRRGGRPAC